MGDAVLAGLLRRRDSSQLRKAQILHLCHLWRYSSNVWRPRKSANTAAAAPASAAAATGQQRTASTPQSGSVRAVVPGPSRPPSPQPVTGVNVAPSLQQALQAAVVPHCQQAAYWLEGPQMRVQVAAVNAEVFDMQQRLADSPAEATKLFKAVQATTRTLQAICGEAKTAGELSVAAKVPAVRRTLERFVLRVRGITQAAGNGPSAFWLGNLKHKGLDGREVPSQLYPGAEDDDVEEEEEDGGGGEESDPASKKRKLS